MSERIPYGLIGKTITTYSRTGSGVILVQSTSNMCSVIAKCVLQKLRMLALIAVDGGPKSYKPAIPNNKKNQ